MVFFLLSLFLLLLLQESNSYTTCDGTNECSGTVINDNYIYCYGYEGCSSSNISATLGLFCFGYYGCGRYYGTKTNIYAGNAVYCDGHSACYNSIISSGSFLFCSGENGCYNSTIKKATHLYGDGDRSNYNSIIYNTSYIYGWGYQSFYYATIIVNNKFARTSIMFYGYYSGKNATIHCYSGSTCVLDCQGNACTYTTMYCYSGSTCNYVTSSILAVFPTVYTSLSFEQDKEIDARMQLHEKQKREEIKQLEEQHSHQQQNKFEKIKKKQ